MRRTRVSGRTTSVSLLLVLAMLIAACATGDDTDGPDSAAADDEVEEETDDAGDDDATLTLDDLDPLAGTFTWFPAFHSMVIFVADGAGLWDELHLDVEMQQADSGSSMYAMLNAGQTDWTNAGIDTVAQAQDEGRDMLHLYPAVTKMSLNFVAGNEVMERFGITPDAPIEERLEALTQMRVGYTDPNAPTDVYSRYLMSLGGIDPETEGDLISVGSPPNLIAALRTGQIDAFMLTPPSPNQPEVEGFGTVFIKASVGEIESLNDFPYSGFSARAEWLEDPENHEATVRFVAGLILAADLIRDEPEEAMGYLADFFPDMDQETLQAGFEDMIPSVPEDPMLDPEMVDRMLDIVMDGGIYDFNEPPSSEEGVLWTNSYVEEASQLLADLNLG